MKTFRSVEEYEKYYFPKAYAEEQDKKLREEDPDEWLRRKIERETKEIFERIGINL
jgi:hypothetical protein